MCNEGSVQVVTSLEIKMDVESCSVFCILNSVTSQSTDSSNSDNLKVNFVLKMPFITSHPSTFGISD
jgi:hypothetical protein